MFHVENNISLCSILETIKSSFDSVAFTQSNSSVKALKLVPCKSTYWWKMYHNIRYEKVETEFLVSFLPVIGSKLYDFIEV